VLLPSPERGQARLPEVRQLLRVKEGFEEPDVDDVADSLVAVWERLGAGVELLRDLVRYVETRHQLRRVDRERGELDAVGCDQVVLLGSVIVDRDLEGDAAELASLVADLQWHAPWSIAEPWNLDLRRLGLAGHGEPVPLPVGRGRVEPLEPVRDSSGEHDVEVRRRPCLDAEAELHRGATLDDEEVPTIVVTKIVEHPADHADPNEVHDTLGKLSDLCGVALQQTLELLRAARAVGHHTRSTRRRSTYRSCSFAVIAPR
jgi:hypothetical protein